jgi:hypothetical protein
MRLSYAFLADAADVHGGKVYVLGGGITVLWRPQYPAPIGVTVVASFAYNAAETDKQRVLRMEINDADGKPVAPPMEATFQFPPRAEGAPTTVPLEAVFAIRIADAPIIPEPGLYAVELLVGGDHVRSLPFAVATPAAP